MPGDRGFFFGNDKTRMEGLINVVNVFFLFIADRMVLFQWLLTPPCPSSVDQPIQWIFGLQISRPSLALS
jgi:hypothetical protein